MVIEERGLFQVGQVGGPGDHGAEGLGQRLDQMVAALLDMGKVGIAPDHLGRQVELAEAPVGRGAGRWVPLARFLGPEGNAVHLQEEFAQRAGDAALLAGGTVKPEPGLQLVHAFDVAVRLGLVQQVDHGGHGGGIVRRLRLAAHRGGHEEQTGHPARVGQGVVDGDAPALGAADQHRLADLQIVQQRAQVMDVGKALDIVAGLAEAAAVIGHDAVGLRKAAHLRLPHAAVGDAGMQEDHGRAPDFLGAGLDTGQHGPPAGDREVPRHNPGSGGGDGLLPFSQLCRAQRRCRERPGEGRPLPPP